MNPETKQCQNCSNDFVIETEDFEFYKKIDVPAPTFCPDCRLQRRLSFFNLTKLYKRDCDLCGKGFISMYHPEAPHTIYCPKCWWSDEWDFRDYAQEYDFSRPFFEQFDALLKKTPLLGLSLGVECLDSSPYNNHADDLNRCYLVFQASYCEDVMYSLYSINNRSVLDSNNIGQSERCYDILHGFKSHSCVGCYNISESMNCYFMRDCNNCQDCFGCTNLRNKKYCWFNEQLDEKEYKERLSEIDLGSYEQYQKYKQQAQEFWKTQPPKPLHFEMAPGCTGNYVFSSSNCTDSFDSSDAQDCKRLFMCTLPPIKDSHDITCFGSGMQSCYESCVVGFNTNKVFFSQESGFDIFDSEYCKLAIRDVRNCFGCVSPRKGKYVIFNKQYSKEEYEGLLPKIKQHMNDRPYVDAKGREYKYGEFFPLEISPFAYQDTLASIFFPITDQDVSQNGYVNYAEKENQYNITIQADDLPDNIKDIDESILKQVVSCSLTQKAYQIQPAELQFLKQMNLPLPRVAPIERILEKAKRWTREIQLVERESSISGEKFMTPYSEEDAPHILSPEEYKREFLG